MTSALEGGRGVVEKWTTVLISCVIMYVTRGEGGVEKSKIFVDVIDGSPLTLRKQVAVDSFCMLSSVGVTIIDICMTPCLPFP